MSGSVRQRLQPESCCAHVEQLLHVEYIAVMLNAIHMHTRPLMLPCQPIIFPTVQMHEVQTKVLLAPQNVLERCSPFLGYKRFKHKFIPSFLSFSTPSSSSFFL
ncbi:rCG57989 [Rattus norvegicus]|uniref:RCG57989 n=1 Tax=Rattus norvegicus TaxID=10116 RepID=A6J506_RAT|nr:rCG57989 [Rattus norvegicus]